MAPMLMALVGANAVLKENRVESNGYRDAADMFACWETIDVFGPTRAAGLYDCAIGNSDDQPVCWVC